VLDVVASGTDQQFKDDELEEIVSTAHMLGRKVQLTPTAPPVLNAALRAGVDTIEHGTFLDAASIELFKKTGAWYVPTVIAGKTVESARRFRLLPARGRGEGARRRPAHSGRPAPRARGRVKVAFGTDAGVYPHGENAREFQYMVEAGMTPAAAIEAATKSAAGVLGIEAEAGTLEVGKRGGPGRDQTQSARGRDGAAAHRVRHARRQRVPSRVRYPA